MAHEREVTLAAHLDFELVHQALVQAKSLLILPEELGAGIAGGAVGHGEAIGQAGAQLHLEELQHGQQRVAQAHVEAVQPVERVERHAGEEALRVVGPAQVLAVGCQAVVVDGGEDLARMADVADPEAVGLHQAAGLLLVAAGGLDRRKGFLGHGIPPQTGDTHRESRSACPLPDRHCVS